MPGKHFPQLQPAEQAVGYEATAVEYAGRRKFDRHVKTWGAAHTRARASASRASCLSDAIDDPDQNQTGTELWTGTHQSSVYQ